MNCGPERSARSFRNRAAAIEWAP